MAVQVVAVPAFWLFFLQTGPGPSMWVLIAALLLADIGIAALGSLLAGLGMAARNREVLVPVLFLPFAIPLVITASTLHRAHNCPANRRYLHRQAARISGSL